MKVRLLISIIVVLCLNASLLFAQTNEKWEQLVAAAQQEGKVVVSIPSSADLRNGLQKAFKQRYGIQVETVTARGSASVRKIADEYKAGVRYFDLHLGGSQSIVTGLLPEGILEPVANSFLLSEVTDTKNWWGGHIWTDNAKKFIYTSLAYSTENLWYNAELMKPEEIRSFDDLLKEKWKGKMGFLDPRTPGSGASLWSYLREIKGEGFLKQLVEQQLVLGRDQRVLAENVAKGKLTLVMGLTYYSFAPFVKAGLPVHPLPEPKEGVYVSGGSGHLVVLKDAPHPNATKVFVNWLLGKEGQDIFSRTMGQGTRRLDVDTKWLKEVGVTAAKDIYPPEEYAKRENNSEEKIHTVREPAAALARKLLGQ
ncbi:MAG TPA: extracellular solute-binding protein [Candidatus Binatia bacterium]|nr:extracellular solute-binding protein [Candidatus Binatia bacterium]